VGKGHKFDGAATGPCVTRVNNKRQEGKKYLSFSVDRQAKRR
jgi:hypothetical protein